MSGRWPVTLYALKERKGTTIPVILYPDGFLEKIFLNRETNAHRVIYASLTQTSLESRHEDLA